MNSKQQTICNSAVTKAVQQANRESAPDRFIRFPEVLQITGLSRGSIYKQIELGTFPKNIPLGGRATGFLASEVTAWMECRVASSRAATGAV